MQSVQSIAAEVLARFAQGLPAFPAFEPARDRLEAARRRDALQWIFRQGLAVRVETGERREYRPCGPIGRGYVGQTYPVLAADLRLPRLTEEGHAYLSKIGASAENRCA